MNNVEVVDKFVNFLHDLDAEYNESEGWDSFNDDVKEKIRSRLFKYFVEKVYEICFFKKNGDIRYMVCTLNPEYLPKQKGITKAKKQNIDVISVWEVETNDWRSIRINSIAYINPL